MQTMKAINTEAKEKEQEKKKKRKEERKRKGGPAQRGFQLRQP